MKLSQTTKLFLSTSLVAGVILIGNPLQIPQVAIAQSILLAQNVAIKSGKFVKAEAPTTGTARIVGKPGQMYLEIDSSFSTTDQAPDLHVLLEPSATPPKTYSNKNGFINLGKLEKVQGAQRYPIPSNIDISRYKSVVIWCRTANATIGYASLN